jgi:hypothetical protein
MPGSPALLTTPRRSRWQKPNVCGQLGQWFDRVELGHLRGGFEMKVVPKYPALPRLIRVDYDKWRLSMATDGYACRPRTAWSRDEITHAFNEWVARHGEIPLTTE